MTDEEALMATIREQPDSDAPRLVYADWLEEHGDPLHAEFIRVQCEIHRLSCTCVPFSAKSSACQRCLLFKRQVQLESHVYPKLAINPIAVWPVLMSRGFLEAVRVSARDLLQIFRGRRPDMQTMNTLRRHPLRLVELDGFHPHCVRRGEWRTYITFVKPMTSNSHYPESCHLPGGLWTPGQRLGGTFQTRGEAMRWASDLAIAFIRSAA
jgi:uncharacterized protein (TIGR02996 family)